jgi:para-aminobenzoate synthetase component 1
MRKLEYSADELAAALVRREGAALLDSCGVGHLGSHLLVAGVDPIETITLSEERPADSLYELERHLSRGMAAIFTVSYDFGAKLQNIRSRHETGDEPDIYIALFENLLVHDYATGESFVCGTDDPFGLDISVSGWTTQDYGREPVKPALNFNSNFSRVEYVESIETINEHIRNGDTYQANLTQQIRVPLLEGDTAGDIFLRLRERHPAPFAAYINRGESQVVSASPERFFRIGGRSISTSPIKGTRRRGRDEAEDERLRQELLNSEKDRAENTMIVDLLRNDLGRVCDYGSVMVTKLCDFEEHPTLFHLVSTIEGRLKAGISFADVVTALYPCGSITGAPKIRTMQIIDRLEPSGRGLSMGGIGYYVPEKCFDGLTPGFDLSVAIRTMVVRDGAAAFNVGGGITIDSDPEAEYEESLLKAKALLAALGNNQ